jgi:hypothetical protein
MTNCILSNSLIFKIRGVGYMNVVEALLPYGNATKTFQPIFDLEKIFHT